MTQGPLAGVKVLEFAGLGPAPFCGMLLSDLGADVIRIDRPDAKPASPAHIINRGRRSVQLDLKKPEAVELCLELAERAEMLFEGYRPGVMERLGIGPDVVLRRNPRLVYGRMTGWGQTGPLAQSAGHDINYIALSGALHAIGTKERPVPPLNLLGDFGGGALYLAFGMLAALTHARATGQGQVVDAAMTDGAASLMSYFYGFRAEGTHNSERASNRLDGGAHFYDVYQCADGQWLSVGAIEPQFYQLLLEKAGLADDPDFHPQMDKARWPALKAKLAALFALRSRADWCALLEGTDACVAPVLEIAEAPDHPHNRTRGTFLELGGVVQPAPAPRFSVTSNAEPAPPPVIGKGNASALREWGLSEARIAMLEVGEL